MPMRLTQPALGFLVLTGLLTTQFAQTARACPFCFGSLQLTLRERIENPDASLLVDWKSGEPGNLETEVPPATMFEVLKVWQGDFQPQQSLKTDHYYDGRPGERFLLIGNSLDDEVRWDRAIPLSAAAIEYVANLPASAEPITERLRHAFKHLESPDETIANDAFYVLAAADYEDISAAREHLDVASLRKWVHDPETLVMRLGVYGMLLGLAGDEQDIAPLRQRIFQVDADRPIRIGIDGVMGGYLLLTGAAGLDELEAEYLQDPNVKPDNLNAITSALRFMWEYGEGKIPAERLRRSMRLALQHEETQELAIVDLARWQDWSVTPQIVDLFENEPHRSLQRRIVGFLTFAAEAEDDNLSDEELAAVKLARQTLEQIKEDDPQLYRNARRGLIRR